jgi:hypothetical protein
MLKKKKAQCANVNEAMGQYGLVLCLRALSVSISLNRGKGAPEFLTTFSLPFH